MKKIISSVLAGCMVLSAVPATAADINITIDNEEFIPKNALGEVVEPFIDNGSTFLPVRAMGEAVGKEVFFDADNYAVYIGEKPDENEVLKEAYALVGDKIYYKEDIALYGSLETAVEFDKILKYAEANYSKEDIESMLDGMKVSFGEYYGLESIEEYKDILKAYACLEVALTNMEITDEDYSEYVVVKHILVEEESAALEVIAKLEAGADFDALIDEYNTDPGQTSGSYYCFTKGQMVEEFENASFALTEGEVTKTPVQSVYGYHIIKKLPLDKEMVTDTEQIAYNKLLKAIEIYPTEKTVLIDSVKGCKIDGVVYTADDLKAVYEMFTGSGENVDYTEAFEYAVMMNVINKIARNRGITEDIERTIEYEMGIFSLLYEAMFSGTFVVDEEEFNSVYDTMETEIYKDLKVFVDGKLIVPCDANGNYVAPKNVDGSIFVPVRAIVEALGMSAAWDNDTRTVIIEK